MFVCVPFVIHKYIWNVRYIFVGRKIICLFLLLWSVARLTFDYLSKLPAEGKCTLVSACSCTDRGHFCSKNNFSLWCQVFEIFLMQVKTKLNGHQKRITGLAFSQAMNVLISSGADAQVSYLGSQIVKFIYFHFLLILKNMYYPQHLDNQNSALHLEYWWMGEEKVQVHPTSPGSDLSSCWRD